MPIENGLPVNLRTDRNGTKLDRNKSFLIITIPTPAFIASLWVSDLYTLEPSAFGVENVYPKGNVLYVIAPSRFANKNP